MKDMKRDIGTTDDHKGTLIIKLIISIVVLIVVLVVLGKWTKSLRQKYEEERLRTELTKVIDKEGTQGVLGLAGVKVNDIVYGKSGVSLVLDDGSAWQYTSEEEQNMRVWQKCNKTVVHISTSQVRDKSNIIDAEVVNESGSGVLFSTKGYVLTNSHVISKGEAISVTLADGSAFPAKVIGNDPVDDLAVLQIDTKSDVSLDLISFGTSGDLKIGQRVLAIGNPYGYDRTMTQGIISGLGRAVQTSQNGLIMGMIQTDAAIGPGNSGGPLLDLHGNMIGLNAAITTGTEGGASLNFAIPVDTVSSILPDLIEKGKVERGWLDLVPIQMTPQLAEYLGSNVEEGLLVSQVVAGGKAEKAGIRGGTTLVSYGASKFYLGGDIITEINGEKIASYNDYYKALLPTKSGDKADLTIIRDGKTKHVSVVLIEREQSDVAAILH
jgi:S1-C subfamily serine protease